jgi:hypothetical protein
MGGFESGALQFSVRTFAETQHAAADLAARKSVERLLHDRIDLFVALSPVLDIIAARGAP